MQPIMRVPIFGTIDIPMVGNVLWTFLELWLLRTAGYDPSDLISPTLLASPTMVNGTPFVQQALTIMANNQSNRSCVSLWPAPLLFQWLGMPVADCIGTLAVGDG